MPQGTLYLRYLSNVTAVVVPKSLGATVRRAFRPQNQVTMLGILHFERSSVCARSMVPVDEACVLRL